MRSMLLGTMLYGVLAGLFGAAPAADAQTIGLEVTIIQRQTPQAQLSIGTDLVLVRTEATMTSRSRVFGEFYPRLNGVRPPIGSIIDLEMGGQAVAASTASAAIDNSRVQNGVSQYCYVYMGDSVFFELRGDFLGAAAQPSIGRAWIRIEKITTPAMIPDLTLSGPLNVGTPRRVYLSRPADAGFEYFMVASLDKTPGILLPDNRLIPANPDPLFYKSIDRSDTTFTLFYGFLDGQGRTFDPRITIPSYDLVGLGFYLSYITLDNTAPWGVRSISDAKLVKIVP